MAAPQLSDIYNFLEISPTLGTAGQPTEDQFNAVMGNGYEVVINLAMGDTPRDLANEPQLLADNGIDYVHIPVVFDQPSESDLNQFFEAMEQNQDKKCFVHCIANMRVSAFVFLYRVLKQGMSVDEAKASMNQIWEPNDIWQAFIDARLAERS